MNILISILSVIGLSIIYFAIARHKRYENFYKNVKEGDYVKFYDGENKYHGYIIAIFTNEYALVKDDMIGEEYYIPMNDIHPTLGIKYKK